MRIAYMTNDEVNQNLAAEMAAECGAAICVPLPTDPSPDGQFHAVLYDLDDLQKYRRGEIIALILSSPSTRPRAVHGYDITDEQAKALRRHGVAVCQRLRSGLIRSLCQGGTTEPRDHPTRRRPDRTDVGQRRRQMTNPCIQPVHSVEDCTVVAKMARAGSLQSSLPSCAAAIYPENSVRPRPTPDRDQSFLPARDRVRKPTRCQRPRWASPHANFDLFRGLRTTCKNRSFAGSPGFTPRPL